MDEDEASPRASRHRILLTAHVFDKLRSIDLGLAEFELMVNNGITIEETPLGSASRKEVVLLIAWVRPLHLVVVVDDELEEERIVTLYEPDLTRWRPGFRRRR